MSKYGDLRYVSGAGKDHLIEEMPAGYLHNAAKKLEQRLAGPEAENLALQERERNDAVLNAMKAEIAEREANREREEGGE